jgi:cell shape-determining protein MreC
MTLAVRAKQFLILATVVLVLLSLLPLRFSGWVGWFAALAQGLVAPIAHPLAQFGRWIVPADPRRGGDPAILALEEQNEELKSTLLRTLDENLRLRRVIQDLQQGAALHQDSPVRQVFAPVYGSAADLASGVVRVRAGRAQGVTQGSVATAPGLQLLGRVTGVDTRTCVVLPMTARSAGPLQAIIMAADGSGGLLCTLAPSGDGTLRGPVEFRRAANSPEPVRPEIGAVVRLRDSGWPAHAQMLLVGEVERVEPAPDQPLRTIVVVRPSIPRLERVAEAVIRVTPEADAEGARR